MVWFQRSKCGLKSAQKKGPPVSPLLRRSYRRTAKMLDKTQGYRFGVIWCAIITGMICLMNSIFTAWASKRHRISNGSVTLHDGSCTEAKTLDMWLHLVINGLSTIVLGASNYTMQCLSAPTREEVDNAHREHTWLDIGIPSLRNLFKISRVRLILWTVIATSSVPIHLLYNSAVFTTMSANEYSVYTVSQNFLLGAPFTINSDNLITYDSYGGKFGDGGTAKFQNLTSIGTLEALRRENASMDILDYQSCINAYSTEFLSSRGSVLLVTAEPNNSTSVLTWSTPRQLRGDYAGSDAPYNWICFSAPVSNFPTVIVNDYRIIYRNATTGVCDKNPSPWSHLGYKVNYCISQQRRQHCQVQFSIDIMIFVLVCNLVKSSIMIYLAWNKKEAPLITTGDAISSFLDRPDPTTVGACMTHRKHYLSKHWDIGPRSWHKKRWFWFHAPGILATTMSNVLFVSLLLTLGYLLIVGFANRELSNRSISHLWALGFGTVTPESLVRLRIQGDSLISTTLISNSPQVVLSLSYIIYNRLFTRMLQAQEWSEYAQKRQPLRVSSPKGKQMSTYYLQLPYIYGVPLLLSQFLLHWLVSQSIFLARVVLYDENDQPMDGLSILTCGYSLIAMIFTLIFGFMVVVCGIANLSRRLKAGMPLVGSCSAAISAACHAPRADIKASRKAVQWGALPDVKVDRNGRLVGHCCFTSFPVQAPKENVLYAGLSTAF